MATAAIKREFGEGVMRGLSGHCPNCGEGRLFSGYLKVEPRCECCGHELGAYRADDGPAYFTILIIGHLVIAPLLCLSFIWTMNPWIVCAISLPLIALITLAALPRVKGAFIGALWASHGGGAQ